MNAERFSNYRKLVEQVWIPIFGQDEYDTEMLLEGCRLAGLKVIEYTLRRSDAAQIIPTLKARFPEAVIFVGSTIDDDGIANQMKAKFPQMMTIGELAPYVDGFVSMLPYSDETLKKYSPTHLCIPAAEKPCGRSKAVPPLSRFWDRTFPSPSGCMPRRPLATAPPTSPAA